MTVADSSNTHTNDQVQQHADPALSAAAAEVADLTTRILELRDAYYERDEVLAKIAQCEVAIVGPRKGAAR